MPSPMNIAQVFSDNPASINQNDDVFYFGQKSGATYVDAAITYDNFVTQLNIPGAPAILPGYNANIFYPQYDVIATNLGLATAVKIFAIYIGYVTKSVTINNIYMYLSVNAGPTGQVGLLSSSGPPNNSNQTLTLIGQGASNISAGGTGVIGATSSLGITVSAGTYLWAAYSTQTTGGTTTSSFTPIEFGLGGAQTFSGDYLASGTTSWNFTKVSAVTNGSVQVPYLVLST